MPGDSVPTGVPGQAVTISNTGTGALRYAISGTSTDADSKHLNTQLLVTVRQPDGNAGSSCTLMTGNTLFSAVVPTAGVNMVGDKVFTEEPTEAVAAEAEAAPVEEVDLEAALGGGIRKAPAHGFRQFAPDSIGDHHVQHTPKQLGAASAGDRIEDDDHREEQIMDDGPCPAG